MSNKEKLKKAVKINLKKNEIILNLKTKIKIEDLKNKVKNEKNKYTDDSSNLDIVKKTLTNQVNDITKEKIETLLNNMNINHSNTVNNFLNLFQANSNLNDAFICELWSLMKNDRKYLSLFETFGKTINQLLLTNLNVRESDLKIIQNQQRIINNWEISQSTYDEKEMISVSEEKHDEEDSLQLTELSIDE